MEGLNDFMVESRGHCFLCLAQITAHSTIAVESPEPAAHGSNDYDCHSVFSLRYLSHHLKMDLAKVFNNGIKGEGAISSSSTPPPELLAKVKKSNLKVSLCGECAHLNEKTLEVFRRLEKIEMELGICLNGIHLKLRNNKAEATNFRRFPDSSDEADLSKWNEKLNIMEVLRNEMEEKCSQNLHSAQPRVKLRNLTALEINTEREKVKSFIASNLQEPLCFSSSISNDDNYLDLENEAQDDHDDEVMECSSNTDPIQDDSNYSEISISNPSQNDKKSFNFEKPKNLIEAEVRGNANKKSFLSIINSSSDSAKSNGESKGSLNLETGKYKCNLCPKEFSTQYVLNYHFKGVHLKLGYKCIPCDKIYHFKNIYYEHHRQVHMSSNSNQKRQTGRITADKRSENSEIKIESDVSKNTAKRGRKPTEENQTFILIVPTSGKEIGQPPETWINPETKKYECKLCSKEFMSEFGVKSHYETVHLKIRYKCKLCEREFTFRVDCNRHYQSAHLGVKFKCNVCSKDYERRDSLMCHIKTAHSGITKLKAHVCGECGKKFKHKTGLTRHIQRAHK